MRLINTKSMELVEFFDKDVPEYAILSHTWEEEEITFEEYMCAFSASGTSSFTMWTALHEIVGPAVRERVLQRAGYHKIQKAAKRAKADGWKWIWIDTCCINKTSSAELSESINSMWRFYEESKICYALLSDVTERGRGLKTLEKSRWFTRGWTLQELIAPAHVVFYNSGWRRIGTKHDLASDVAQITGIQWDLLRGVTSPGRYSVAQRTCWSS